MANDKNKDVKKKVAQKGVEAKAVQKKPAAVKAAKADKIGHKQIKVTQVRSGIASLASQKGTLKGLGLRGMNSVSVLEDTASVRGMITKVRHLVKFETL
jgi:large subunit ribosomal protein L30